jgi:hypothetical protein
MQHRNTPHRRKHTSHNTHSLLISFHFISFPSLPFRSAHTVIHNHALSTETPAKARRPLLRRRRLRRRLVFLRRSSRDQIRRSLRAPIARFPRDLRQLAACAPATEKGTSTTSLPPGESCPPFPVPPTTLTPRRAVASPPAPARPRRSATTPRKQLHVLPDAPGSTARVQPAFRAAARISRSRRRAAAQGKGRLCRRGPVCRHGGWRGNTCAAARGLLSPRCGPAGGGLSSRSPWVSVVAEGPAAAAVFVRRGRG